jgi:hypothetical protein
MQTDIPLSIPPAGKSLQGEFTGGNFAFGKKSKSG